MVDYAGAAEQDPNVHVTLYDGTTTLGLMLTRPEAIAVNPHPRTATQISQGQSEYSNLVLPYKEKVQQDWSGGRGQLDLEDNQTKYLDAKSIITHHEKRLVLGAQAEWADDYLRSTLGLGPLPQKSILTTDAAGTTQYYAGQLSPGSTVTAKRYILWVQRIGTPENLTVELRENNAGSPGTLVANTQATLTTADYEQDIGYWTVVSCTGGTSAGNDPWLVIYGGDTDDSTNYWMIAYYSESGASLKYSADGSSWTPGAADFGLIGRAISVDEDIPGKYFNYKGVEYFVSQPTDGGNSKLYMNGDRGVVDSGSTTTLVDGSKSWASDFWSDRSGYVLFLTGDASRQNKPYSAISTNNGTTLTFATVDIAPAAGDEYAIVGTTYFASVKSFSNHVTDFAVADKYVAFAFGEDAGVALWYEYSLSGTWTTGLAASAQNAEKLQTIRKGDGDMLIWGTRNNVDPYGTSVWYGWVPELIGADADAILHNRIGVLATTTEAWQEQRITNVTSTHQDNGIYISVAGGFTTGVIASRLLDSAVDITGARYIGFMVKSSVVAAAGEIEFVYNQVPSLGQSYLPSHVFVYKQHALPSLVYYSTDDTNPNTFPISNLSGYDTDYSVSDIEDGTGALFVGFTDRFDRMEIIIGSVNAATAAMTVLYWNGTDWSDASATDGTDSSGVSLAISGGDVSFTLPDAWNKGNDFDVLSNNYFWLKIEWDAALTATTEIDEIRLWSTNWDLGVVESWKSIVRCFDTNVNTYDRVSLRSDGYLYIGCANKFNKITVDVGNPNAVTATMTTEYSNGSGWTAVTGWVDSTISGGATLAIDEDMDFNMPYDWEKMTIEGQEAYWIRMQTSADLTDLVDLVQLSLFTNTAEYIDLPALAAGDWTWVLLDIQPGDAVGDADARTIQSVGFNLTANLGAQVIQVYGPIHLIGEDLEHIPVGSSDEKITGIGSYGDERRNPWVGTETQAFEVQTENENTVVPIPLDEMATLRSLKNFTSITTSDAYLVFNLGPRLQRYISQTLENLGPTGEEGLPEDRQGDIVAIQSAPGQIFFAIDGEDNYSSVMVYDNSGMHELYRAPKGERIWDIHLQTLPYERDLLRLWVIQGGDILYVPVGITRPDKVAAFRYEHQGYLVTSWITSGNIKVEKLFRALHLFTEDLSGGHQQITVQYQTDTGEIDSGWTDIAIYSTSPSRENYISTVGSDVQGTRIRFRFILETDDNTITPVLDAFDLEMLFRVNPRDVFTMQVIAGDRIDNLTGEIDETLRAEDIIDQLKTWAGTPATLLTFNNQFSSWDAKTVIVEPFPQSPEQPLAPGIATDALERILCEVTVMEV